MLFQLGDLVLSFSSVSASLRARKKVVDQYLDMGLRLIFLVFDCPRIFVFFGCDRTNLGLVVRQVSSEEEVFLGVCGL